MSTFDDWPLATVAQAVNLDYSQSVMICLRPPEALRERFAEMEECTESVEDLHITLLYLGSVEDVGGDIERERLFRACYGMALESSVLKGTLNGFGWFLNDDTNALVALWDIPYIVPLRQRVVDHCNLHGVPLRTEDHGFTPHMTLGFEDETPSTIPSLPAGDNTATFDSLWLVWGEEWQEIHF